MVVGYRVSPTSYRIAKALRMLKTDVYSLPNILARACGLGREPLVPEFMQDDCTPENLAHATLDLLIDGETGIWHLANQGRLSWHEFAYRVAEGAGYDPALVLPVDGPAANTALTSARGLLLRPVDQAIDDFLDSIGERASGSRVVEIAAE